MLVVKKAHPKSKMSLPTSQNLCNTMDPNYDLGLDQNNFSSSVNDKKEWEYNNLSRIINDMLSTSDLEEYLQRNASVINQDLVNLLHRRRRIAKIMGEKTSAHALELLSRRIENDLCRSACSPPLLLLDDCLREDLSLVDFTSKDKLKDKIRRHSALKISHILSSTLLNQNLPTQVFKLSSAITKTTSETVDFRSSHIKYVSKEEFKKEITLFYIKALAILKWKIGQHRMVEVITQVETLKIDNRERRNMLSINLTNKRLIINRQILFLNKVARILEIAKKL